MNPLKLKQNKHLPKQEYFISVESKGGGIWVYVYLRFAEMIILEVLGTLQKGLIFLKAPHSPLIHCIVLSYLQVWKYIYI